VSDIDIQAYADQFDEDVTWRCHTDGCTTEGKGQESLNLHMSAHISMLGEGWVTVGVSISPGRPAAVEGEPCSIHPGWIEPCMACVAGGYT